VKTTKLKIKNVLGIKELELNGESIELTGTNGAGKSSVLDAIRKALTNDFPRDVIVRQGENESEILIETDSGLKVERKIRADKADYFKVTENGKQIPGPQTFLNEIFTPLQLNPVQFTQMSRQEKNRMILDLIEFDWDLNWIKEQFGEIPAGIDYEQNILQVLNDIQADNGDYYKDRQEINSRALHLRKTIEDIASEIPANYQAKKWEDYNLGEKYKGLETIRKSNNEIERAKAFKDSYDGKIRSLEAKKQIAITAEEKTIANEKQGLLSSIERLKAEIKAAEEKLLTLDDKLKDKIKIAESEYREQVAMLDSDIQIANKYTGKDIADISGLQSEIETAEKMKLHLNEYRRLIKTKEEWNDLTEQSKGLTRKIELARELPSEILRTATIPVKGLTVKDGIPLVNGLPISNLSEGEQLQLCVDVAISKPSGLQIILIDGTENLSTENRKLLYQKCKEKGLQFVATRVTDDDELIVTAL